MTATDPARRRRELAFYTGGPAAVLALALVTLTIGLHLGEVLRTITGDGDAYVEFVVGTLRLPRLASAIVTGAAFGISGAIFQGLTRNALASPDIIGVTAGASAAAVVAVLWLGASSFAVSGAAFAGALAATAAVYLLAYRRGAETYRLVLVGIGIGALLTALTNYLITRAQISDTQRAFVWLVGSLNEQTWELVRTSAFVTAALLPLAWLLERPLRLLVLGDEQARGLGLPVQTVRAMLVFLGAALAGAATATVGPVGFVALLAPNIARIALGRAQAPLAATALVGCLIMIAADLAATRTLPSTPLPVGVVTPLVGAPFLLWLLHRRNIHA